MSLRKIKNKDISRMASKLDRFVKQENPEQYSNEMIINDVLYFLGVSIDEKKFSCANGYDKLKKHVQAALDSGK